MTTAATPAIKTLAPAASVLPAAEFSGVADFEGLAAAFLAEVADAIADADAWPDEDELGTSEEGCSPLEDADDGEDDVPESWASAAAGKVPFMRFNLIRSSRPWSAKEVQR